MTHSTKKGIILCDFSSWVNQTSTMRAWGGWIRARCSETGQHSQELHMPKFIFPELDFSAAWRGKKPTVMYQEMNLQFELHCTSALSLLQLPCNGSTGQLPLPEHEISHGTPGTCTRCSFWLTYDICSSGEASEKGTGTWQITWWILRIKKMRGNSGKKIARKSRNSCEVNGRGCGCTRDSWLKAQLCKILEPNTNAQRMSFLSFFLGFRRPDQSLD